MHHARHPAPDWEHRGNPPEAHVLLLTGICSRRHGIVMIKGGDKVFFCLFKTMIDTREQMV